MRQLVLIWLFWIFGAGISAADAARPAEAPPADFPGAQYIDSAGCVFVRDGRGWSAKQGDDGAPLCGFPPSRSAWARAEVADAPPSMADIERDLTVSLIEAEGARVDLAQTSRVAAGTQTDAAHHPTIAENHAQPEVAAKPAQKIAAPDPGLGAQIERALHAEPALEARMTATLDPNARLCELLGMRAAAKGNIPFGADPTRGYCAGQAPGALPGTQALDVAAAKRGIASTPASVTVASRKAATAPVAKVTAGVTPRPSGKIGTHTRAAAPQKSGKATDAKSAQAAPRQSSDTEAGRVPAGARYVQIGQFNADGVAAAIAALRSMGYPVARQVKVGEDGQRIVLAGPFESRERLIAALDRLQKAGFGAALAR